MNFSKKPSCDVDGQRSSQDNEPLLLMPSASLFRSVEKEAVFNGMKDDVIVAIRHRENLMTHLRDSIYGANQRSLSGMQDSLVALHEASISVIESIIEIDSIPHETTPDSSFDKSLSCDMTTTFLWEGKNYLLKMLTDSKFLCKIQLVMSLVSPKTNLRRNPFLLPLNVDEIIAHGGCDESSRAQNLHKDMEKVPWKLDLNRLYRAAKRIIFEEKRTRYGYGNEKNHVHVAPNDHKHGEHVVELHVPPLPTLNLIEVEDAISSPHLSFDDALVICSLKLLLCGEVDASIGIDVIPTQTVYRVARRHVEDIAVLLQTLGSERGRCAIFVDKYLLIAIHSTILRYLDKVELQKAHQNETMGKLMAWLLDILTLRSKDEYSNCRDDSIKESSTAKADNGRCRLRKGVKFGGKENNEHENNTSNHPVVFESDRNMKETADEDEDEDESVLVPIPTWCAVSATEGSTDLTIVMGNIADHLTSGDKVRIGHPHLSLDYTIAPGMSGASQNGAFSIIEAYDHSPILENEFVKEVDSISRLHDPQFKDKEPMMDNLLEEGYIPCKRAIILAPSSQSAYGAISQESMADRSPLSFQQIGLWKLIPKELDKRLEWRRDYDNGLVRWMDVHSNSSNTGEYLRVKWHLSRIERDCFDPIYDPKNSIHQHRLQYFERVSLDDIISETFRTVCNHWHPISSSIDIFKWAKLARSMKFLSKVKNSNHEVDMAFFRHSQKRKLNLSQFHSVLMDMASIKYPSARYDSSKRLMPHIALKEALSNMLWTTVAMLPQVNSMIWTKAKEMAVQVELNRVCSQTRISARIRMIRYRVHYITMRAAAICIQKYTRTMLASIKRRRRLLQAHHDRLYRLRYQSAVICQKYWRRYPQQCRFIEHKKEQRRLKEEYHAKLWQELHCKYLLQQKSIVFRKALNIQSILTIVTIVLHDSYSMEKSIELELNVYVPQTFRSFQFSLNKHEMNHCLEDIIIRKGPLSWKEMVQHDVLLHLSSRLIAKHIRGQPVIALCKRSIAEKGVMIVNRSVRLDGSLYIITIYRSAVDIVVRLYDPKKALELREVIQMSLLIEWLLEDEREHLGESLGALKYCEFVRRKKNKETCSPAPDVEISPQSEMPSLLQQVNQPSLIIWLITRIHVHDDEDTGGSRIILEYELEAARVERIAMKFQSIWRSKVAKNRAKKEVHVQYEKHYDRSSGIFFYVNIREGTRQWGKPALLGNNDDLQDPPDEWRETQYVDPETGATHTYYFNPLTGQSSWLSEEEAARLVQRKFRSGQTKELLNSNLTFHQIVKALLFVRDVELKYERQPERLSNKVNFALLNHLLRLNMQVARTLYKEAIAVSPCHPVIARAYGIFILANCEPPVMQTFDKSCRLFREAHAADPESKLFQSARENFFYWSVVMHPNDPYVLLNYALLHQCILGEYYRAEKIYRRALGLDPHNIKIAENFNLFIEQRYPGGYYSGNGVPAIVIRRSEDKEMRPEWGEWKIMFDPLCTKDSFDTFWYNFVENVSSFTEPDWEEAWSRRVARSKCMTTGTGTKNLWVEYYDVALDAEFVYNRTTKEYVWKSFGGGTSEPRAL